MHPTLALPLVLAALVLSGCDAFKSFETLCEKRLPPTKIEVIAEPISYTTDLSRPAADLAAKSSHGNARRVMGLVTTDLKSTVSLGGSGMTDRRGERVCMRPAVTVKLAFSPMTLFIAREHPQNSCAHRITLEHEYKHIRVYQQYLDGIARDIDEQLRAELGTKALFFRTEAEGEAHVQEVLAERLGPYVENTMLRVVDLQRQVDSSEEYARLDRAEAECEQRASAGAAAQAR